MSFASVGGLGTANSKTAGTTLVITTTADAEVGHLVIVETAWDNADTADVEGIRMGCSDSAGNLYAWIGGFVNANAAGGAGAEVAVFASIIETQLSSGGTITITHGNSITAKAATAHEFTIGSGYVCLAKKANLSTDAADPGSLTLSSLPSREYLLLHGLAGEGPSTDAYTWDTDYTEFANDGTTGGLDATNMHIRGGYRIATLTTDTVDVTSTTADRDYAQVFLALREYDTNPPSAPLLDDFDRANETPLGAPWAITDLVGLRLISNAVGVQALGTPARAEHQYGFGGDLEASATISAALTDTTGADALGLAAHVTGTGALAWNGYTLTGDNRGAGKELLLLRYVVNAALNLRALTVATLAHLYIQIAANDQLCLKTVDTAVECWILKSGGSFRFVAAIDDTTMRNGTVVAVIRENNAAISGRLNDFRAQTLEPVQPIMRYGN